VSEGDTDALLAAVARAPDAAPERSLVGADIGRYHVEGLLGRGGMGVVYRARDTLLDRAVALKALPTDRLGDADRRARFLREARAAAALSHPNVVTLHDVLEHEGQVFVVMELVTGKPLRDFIGDEKVPLAKRIDWLAAIARGLEAAHRAGIVHRDVKPENVIVADDGAVKVVDFGLARAVDGPVASSLTAEGALVGTPRYMAPEQISGDEVDARADQFAWGVVAHEVITGHDPWESSGAPINVVLARILTSDPKTKAPPTGESAEILRDVVARTLAKKKEARFASMSDVRAALEKRATPRPSRRGLAKWAVGVGVAIVGGAVLFQRARSSSRAMRIIDHPLPATRNAAALDAYRLALQHFRDANWIGADAELAKVVAADSSVAAAWVRYALTGRSFGSTRAADERTRYRRAVALREELSPRDRGLLFAIEPACFAATTTDWAEVRRRFAEVNRDRNDAEILDIAAQMLITFDPKLASEWAARAVEIDPAYADAWQGLGDALANLGMLDEGRRAFEKGIQSSPNSTDAHYSLALLLTELGDAAAAERSARQVLVIEPAHVAARQCLAGAAYAQGAAPAAVRELLRAHPLGDSESQAKQDVDDDVAIASLSGDFVRAAAREEDLRRAYADGSTLFGRPRSWLLSIRTALETGDIARAGGLAMECLRLADAQSWDDVEPIPLALAAAVSAGLVDASKARERRSRWLADATRSLPPSVAWAMAFGPAVVDPGVIGEARVALPRDVPWPFHRYGLVLSRTEAAKAFRALGDRGRAMEMFRLAAQTCLAPSDPFLSTHAHLGLAQMLEESGAIDEARKHYRVVVDRWGNAKPRSLSAELAKSRLG
jgi:tetratricopeptide (TPR) repeat protein/predicted Ser/Thr protein kinase